MVTSSVAKSNQEIAAGKFVWLMSMMAMHGLIMTSHVLLL
jgi:hypothetical protein